MVNDQLLHWFFGVISYASVQVCKRQLNYDAWFNNAILKLHFILYFVSVQINLSFCSLKEVRYLTERVPNRF